MGGILTKEEVQSFLEQFHAKMKVYDILFRDDWKSPVRVTPEAQCR